MHKEERKAKNLHNQVGWVIFHKNLKVSIDIFHAFQHGDRLMNFVTGKIYNDVSVIVDDNILLGGDQVKKF